MDEKKSFEKEIFRLKQERKELVNKNYNLQMKLSDKIRDNEKLNKSNINYIDILKQTQEQIDILNKKKEDLEKIIDKNKEHEKIYQNVKLISIDFIVNKRLI